MRTELFISWRYLITKRKEKFISLISIISIAGVAIGVMALIVVIGVMTGFDQQLRDKIVGNYSHISLFGYQPIEKGEAEATLKKITAHPSVLAASPYIQGQTLLKEGGKFFAVGLRGVDPAREAKVSKIKDYLQEGKLENLVDGTVIIGRELARNLNLGLNSQLSFYTASGKEYKLKVAGIFHSGMYEYDLNLVLMPIGNAQEILGLSEQISAVAIKLKDLYLAKKVRDELAVALGFRYNLRTWMEANANFFAALNLEKFTMFIILTLIILVACFNIASTLIVMVVEKTKDIGVLKALGMSAAGVRKVFTYEGLTIGCLGVLFGALGGLGLCALLKKYQFIKLPQDIYYIDKLPVAIQLWPDVIVILVSAMAIVLLSTLYPAHRAAKLQPVEALRYE
jgi:lipoprotein-releasing system permease protein